MSKIAGYQNPNGDQSKVEPVRSLLKAESKLKGVAKSLLYAMAAGERAEKKLQALQDKCTHRVFIDAPGEPYDIRHCCICGAGLGLI